MSILKVFFSFPFILVININSESYNKCILPTNLIAAKLGTDFSIRLFSCVVVIRNVPVFVFSTAGPRGADKAFAYCIQLANTKNLFCRGMNVVPSEK